MVDFKKLAEETKAQVARTLACERHDFGEWQPDQAWGRFTCKHCGAEWRISEIGTYIRGYEAAGGDGQDILRGWQRAA